MDVRIVKFIHELVTCLLLLMDFEIMLARHNIQKLTV